jgi:hypothetical protein
MSNTNHGNVNINLSQCQQLADEIKQELLTLIHSAINNNSPAKNYAMDDQYSALITSALSSAPSQDLVSRFFRRHQHSTSSSTEQEAIDMVLQAETLREAASNNLGVVFGPQFTSMLNENKLDACKDLIGKLPACSARMRMAGRLASAEEI